MTAEDVALYFTAPPVLGGLGHDRGRVASAEDGGHA
jgi:hypothetical protein